MTTPIVTGADVINYGRQFLGVPYVWGGTSPKGFDCSGLIVYIYRHFGISLPRTSQEQAHTGITVPASAIQAGDLLFYDTTGPNSHVALYAGNGMQLVARHSGLPVQFQKVGNFTHAQRVLHGGAGASAGGIAGTTPAGYFTAGGLNPFPSPQEVMSGFLEALGVPDMKDLFERLGLILLGGGLVLLGLILTSKTVQDKVTGTTKQYTSEPIKKAGREKVIEPAKLKVAAAKSRIRGKGEVNAVVP